MSERRREFGWVLAGTLFGAVAGCWLAQVPPVDENKGWARREATLKTADRIIPFVVAGSVVGSVVGWLAERRFGGKVSLSRALTVALVLAFIVFVTSDLVPTIFHLIRTHGESVR